MHPALTLLSFVLGLAAILAYSIGLYRRWRPSTRGRPAWVEDLSRAKEPWSLRALCCLIAAIACRALAYALD